MCRQLKGILYLLNECGYPNIHNAETLAVIRLCKDLLHVEKPEAEDEETEDSDAVCTNYARGHFYTNDVKVPLCRFLCVLCRFACALCGRLLRMEWMTTTQSALSHTLACVCVMSVHVCP